MSLQRTLVIYFIANILFLGCSDPSRKADKIPATGLLWKDHTETIIPPTQEWTNRVEIGDINSDGLLDLVYANGGNYSEPDDPEPTRILLNQGAGKTFIDVTEEMIGSKRYISRGAKIMDLNGDLLPDLVISTTYQTQTQLFLGTAHGAMHNSTATHLPEIDLSVGDIEFGDVDADGDLDMILADWGAGSNMNNSGGLTRLWLNNGDGKFTDETSTQMPDILIQFSWDLEFIDYDNDYDLDIAVSCKRCATGRLFVNDGLGYFKDVRALPAYTNNYEFEVMDIDGDNDMDLITVNDGEMVDGKSWSRREHIFVNDSAKRFLDFTSQLWPDSANTGEDDNNVVFLDYDSDGDADFILSSLTGLDRLLINNGKGQFSLKQPIMDGPRTSHTLSLVLGDLNQDGKLDIAMGQGEGEDDIEERTYLGENVAADTAKPIISSFDIEDADESTIVKARIHDNKSPSQPHDWDQVVLISDTQDSTDMKWYGEYLWKGTVAKESSASKLCATDFNGNTACVDLR